MNTATLAAITTLTAEVALALHPILIKQVGVGLPTQLVARLGIYSVLGTALSGPKDRQASWGSWSAASKSIMYGLMNLVHIGTSYLSYNHLPAGSALALFYLYPFFNILAGVLFLGESFDTALILPLIIAFIGVLLISKYTEPGGSDSEHAHDKDPKNIPLGIAASIVSALTETMIFLIAKTGEEPTAWLPILKLYPAAFGGLIAAIAVTGTEWKTSLQNWFPLVLFNVFIGFLGYSLRFWSIPRLPTAVFSILTFVGVASAFGWGLLYADEKPSLGALSGAGCIAAALAFLKQKN
jgi:drug/metabolite transporter (DMT)-like permease